MQYLSVINYIVAIIIVIVKYNFITCSIRGASRISYVSKFGYSLHKRKEKENEKILSEIPKKHLIITGMTYNDVANDVVLVYLLLTLNTFHRLFLCFLC